MEECIKRLKDFKIWFEAHAKARTRHPLDSRNLSRFNSLIEDLEQVYEKEKQDKENIKTGLDLLERIVDEFKRMNDYQQVSFWKKLKRIFSW